MNKGTITQIISAVVDVAFKDELPAIYNALKVKLEDKELVLEVEQHLGNNVVRTVAMDSTDGLKRGMEVIDTGKPITVPVGKAVLGRILNVLGEPVDNQVLLGALNSMVEGIQKRGKAVLNEKTMLDTIIPTYNFLEKSFNEGKNLKDIKNEVIEVAKNSMEATKDIIATKGRASYLGERSVGHIDPGAMSSYLMIKTICENI